MDTEPRSQTRKSTGSGTVLRVSCGAVALFGGVSAVASGVSGLLDVNAGGVEAVELCGVPLFWFFLLWHQISGFALIGLAGVLAASAAGLLYLAANGSRRFVAVALVVLTVALSPTPWLLQAQRSGDPTG